MTGESAEAFAEDAEAQMRTCFPGATVITYVEANPPSDEIS
jgi:hypothetical protein